MTLRAVVVGLGWVNREVWAPIIRDHPELELVAAVEPDAAAVQRCRHALDMPILDSCDELADADVAFLGVPNYVHASIAESLLRRGISVFVEKPVCLSAAEVDAIVAAARYGGAHVVPSSAARHRADVRQVWELIATGAIGDVQLVEASWTRSRGIPRPDGWYVRRELAGGGVLLDLGWHLLDLALALLGFPPIRAIAGATSASFVGRAEYAADWRDERHDPSAPKPDVEDTASAFVTFESGAAASIRTAWASHDPLDTTSLRVHGSAGVVALSTTFGFSPNRIRQPQLVLLRDGIAEDVPLDPEPIGTEYRRQVDHLVEVVGGAAPGGVALDELASEVGAVLRIIEEVYCQAARSLVATR